jgi:DNA-binding transcriptional LysR family regulator
MSRASLAELEAVATVARAGGFRAAARELGVSSSALSHSIAALEDRYTCASSTGRRAASQ